jgi:hypothetical protein
MNCQYLKINQKLAHICNACDKGRMRYRRALNVAKLRLKAFQQQGRATPCREKRAMPLSPVRAEASALTGLKNATHCLSRALPSSFAQALSGLLLNLIALNARQLHSYLYFLKPNSLNPNPLFSHGQRFPRDPLGYL